ncbi:MAG TPA: amidase family protein [Actinomycetota bacterium]|nr:amidase family protein [Actinomycetota bacterium]
MTELESMTLTAIDLAEAVRAGKLNPRETVAASLAQIERLNETVGAFEVVRTEKPLAEADALGSHPNLKDLPLAGVPIAIKDNVPVAGEPSRSGSRATSADPQPRDHEVVRRLRDAGAVVVGITRMSEVGVWAMTDNAFGTARNPWRLDRTPGGSSGGAAAAVASAMVPVAQGNDGLGSIRIPSACCGLFGIKPGPDVVPSQLAKHSWFGWAENGVLATTVSDAALVLSVMAGRPDLRDVTSLKESVRIGVSTQSPVIGVPLDKEFYAAVIETARLLAGRGHRVGRARIPYRTKYVNGGLWWYTAGVSDDCEGLDKKSLEPRTRRHAAIGRAARRLGLTTEKLIDQWRRDAARLFEKFDVVVTPTLLRTPPKADGWHHRGWTASMVTQTRYAPLTGWWNIARYPAVSVPAGSHSEGVSIGVQLVGRPGAEGLILSVAKNLEELRPWRRHAPLAETL